MSNYSELEYKYRAEHVRQRAFQKLMLKLPIIKSIQVASWDIYYLQEGSEDSFQRFRMDHNKPELTKKVKTKEANNWNRVESDLPLDPTRITEGMVTFHVGLDGYRENFRIFKTCEIFFTENLNYVYYTVLGEDMQLLGRFIEVEVNKDRVNALEAAEAGLSIKLLREGERLLEAVEITAQNRLKKSLFELYRKVD